jgi:hypothetical protein
MMGMTAATIKLGFLMLGLAPVLIDNIRTGMLKNGLVGALFVAGVAVAFFGPAIGAPPLMLSAFVGWVLVGALLLGAAAFGVVSGGVAKFLIALLPWFSFGDYLLVFTAGMLLTTLVGYITKRNALIVPPMMAAAFTIGLLPVFGFKPF